MSDPTSSHPYVGLLMRFTGLPEDVIVQDILGRLLSTDILLIEAADQYLAPFFRRVLRSRERMLPFKSAETNSAHFHDMTVLPSISRKSPRFIAICHSEIFSLQLHDMENNNMAGSVLVEDLPSVLSMEISDSNNSVVLFYHNGVRIYHIEPVEHRNTTCSGLTYNLHRKAGVIFDVPPRRSGQDQFVIPDIDFGRILTASIRGSSKVVVAHVTYENLKKETVIKISATIVDSRSDKVFVSPPADRRTLRNTDGHSNEDPSFSSSTCHVTTESHNELVEMIPDSTCGPSPMLCRCTFQASTHYPVLSEVLLVADPTRMLLPPGMRHEHLAFLVNPLTSENGPWMLPLCSLEERANQLRSVSFSSCNRWIYLNYFQREPGHLVCLERWSSISGSLVKEVIIPLEPEETALDVLHSIEGRLALIIIGEETEEFSYVRGWYIVDVLNGGLSKVSREGCPTDHFYHNFSISEDAQLLSLSPKKVEHSHNYHLHVYYSATGSVVQQLRLPLKHEDYHFHTWDWNSRKYTGGCFQSFFKSADGEAGLISLTRFKGSSSFTVRH